MALPTHEASAAEGSQRPGTTVRWFRHDVDGRDLVAIGVLYVLVVGLFAVAFEGFGTPRSG